MSGHVKERAQERIAHLAHAGLDVACFLDEASAILASAVPNGTDQLTQPYWYTLDPDSELITSDYGGNGCALDTGAVMRWEYLEDDVNKYVEVLRHPRGVQTLHEVTDGAPERSRVYREYMLDAGLAQEMLVALRTRTGDPWGTVRLNRAPSEPEFDATEIEFMRAVAPHLAEGVRRGLLVGETADPDLADSPGLVVLDRGGDIRSVSTGGERWLATLPGPHVGCGLPASVAAVAAATLQGASAEPSVLVRTVDGQWLNVQGTTIDIDGSARAAVIIEPARRDRITPLLMALYDLTAREREVTRLVLRGCSTDEIAMELRISPHTVQQHLKGVFDKVGVRTRRELIGTIFVDNFERRVDDNGQRVDCGKPIRGGPLRRTPHR